MGEIDRLFAIKPIFTTPYHTAANGTLKSIIKKLCQEQPQQWHRFIPAALFAVREIPNATLQFSPFELLYGRQVRGPVYIVGTVGKQN
jgi:hypothetical protein